MKTVQLDVVVYGATHTSEEIAAALRTVLLWSEHDAAYISISDRMDSSVHLYAERDDRTEPIYEAGL